MHIFIKLKSCIEENKPEDMIHLFYCTVWLFGALGKQQFLRDNEDALT